MAITIESYGTEATKINRPTTQDHTPLKPNESHGRVRVQYFSYIVPTGGEAIGSNVAVAKVPEGARCLGGAFYTDGLGGTATVDIGLMGADGSGFITSDNSTTADDDDIFTVSGALDVAAAGKDVFGDTIQNNFGYETEKECWLVCTAVAAWTATQILRGYIFYVVD